VFWLDDARLESFFRTHFGTPAFYAEARSRLAAFRQVDPVEQYADLLALPPACSRPTPAPARRAPGDPSG
jgi:hypothetical protein